MSICFHQTFWLKGPWGWGSGHKAEHCLSTSITRWGFVSFVCLTVYQFNYLSVPRETHGPLSCITSHFYFLFWESILLSCKAGLKVGIFLPQPPSWLGLQVCAIMANWDLTFLFFLFFSLVLTTIPPTLFNWGLVLNILFPYGKNIWKYFKFSSLE